MNDVTGSDNAEDIFKECVDFQEKTFNGEVTEKILQIKEEFVKFYLKQEKYDVSFFVIEIIKFLF
jgi:hypothetical protein